MISVFSNTGRQSGSWTQQYTQKGNKKDEGGRGEQELRV